MTKESGWLPTDEQIDKFNHYGESVVSEDDWDLRGLAKFTAKKIAERGNEECIDARHYQHGIPIFPRLRFICSQCMQSLLKEIEES